MARAAQFFQGTPLNSIIYRRMYAARLEDVWYSVKYLLKFNICTWGYIYIQTRHEWINRYILRKRA